MFTNLIIKLLFKLLGNDYKKLYSIDYLFGVSSDSSHKGRKKRWEQSLYRLWKDKAMLDFLFYQAESDKEKYWSGKADRKVIQGARIRTLYIAYSAKRAYKERMARNPKNSKNKIEGIKKEIVQDQKEYAKVVDIF